MRTCERCPACRFRDEDSVWPVPGDGPSNAEVAFLFEQPGKQENNMHRPMVGKSGDELNDTYLPISGLVRDEVWIDNTVRCKYADTGEAPPSEVIRVCSEFHARKAIERINPRVLVLSGGVANSLLKLNVDMVHGIGRKAKLWGWEGDVFSIYHPALGIHMSSKMQNLLDDFYTLRGFIRGQVPYARDEYPSPSYYELTTEDEVYSILGYEDAWTEIAIDTESRKTWKGYRSTIRYIPWCLTFCIAPGEAFMIKVESKEAIQAFARLISRFRRIYMHNKPHDMRVLADMGIPIEWDRVQDTMSMSYVDARLPKGLKALSYQLLNAEMRNFEDVVLPYGRLAAAHYMLNASEQEWPEPVQEGTGEMVTKKCPTCKGAGGIGTGRGKSRTYKVCPDCKGEAYVTVEKMTRKQGLGQKISRLLTDYNKNPEIDIVERWCNWGEQVQPMIDRLGPLPLPSVEMVPTGEILSYAGCDAHSTLRIVKPLRQRHVDIRRRFNGENL